MNITMKHVAAAALAICATQLMAQEVVKIGHVGPVSGAIAHLGKDNENAAILAVEELNAKGIKIGGKAVKFELLAEDDAGDPKQGTAAAQKLVDSKVNGVVGHLNSGTSIPASKIYSDAGVPQISPSATNPAMTKLAEARKSVAITGAPYNLSTPVIIALWPSRRISGMRGDVTVGPAFTGTSSN